MGAIQFVENLDRTSLTISDDDFERKVEAAVSTIAEGHREAQLSPQRPARQPSQVQISEKSGISQPEVVPRNSIEAEYSSPSRSTSTRTRPSTLSAADGSEENTAVNGLLRTIQRPLTSLGRMFAEEIEGSPSGGSPNPNPPSSHRADCLQHYSSLLVIARKPRDQTFHQLLVPSSTTSKRTSLMLRTQLLDRLALRPQRRSVSNGPNTRMLSSRSPLGSQRVIC